MELAGIQWNSDKYPSELRSCKTMVSPLERRADTFSAIAHFGRTSLMSRNISFHKPERSPMMPTPFPAVDISWQGNPPVMTVGKIPSVCSCSWVSSFMSLYIFTLGQCLPKTFLHSLSFSQNAAVSNPPAHSRPRENPPMPLKRSSTVWFMS